MSNAAKAVPQISTLSNTVGAFAQEIDSNASVTGNMNSNFKYDQVSDGPLQEITKNASDNKYLLKIAEVQKSVEKKDRGFNPFRGVAAATAGAVLASPLSMISNHMGKGLLKKMDEPGSSDLGTVKKMMRDNKLDVSFNHRNHAQSKYTPPKSGFSQGFAQSQVDNSRSGAHGPSFVPSKSLGGKKDFIGGVKKNDMFGLDAHYNNKKVIKNKDVIMHELGHAKYYQTHGKAKLGARAFGSKIGAGLSGIALSSDKTKDYAAPITAAGQLPTLVDEGFANYHAFKGIKAHKGAAAAKNFLKTTVVKNTGNYWGAAATQVAGAYIGSKLLDIRKKHNDK
jgi:hypothetical protein